MLSIHPKNASRVLWRGRPHFLLASTEHYGAVLNAAFDYERYLDTLAADGLNLTRTFAFYKELEASGGYYHEVGQLLGIRAGLTNPLAPRPEDYLAPWARVAATADPADLGPDGLPKFDLTTWDERYFTRLKRFVAAAAERGVIVELVFFSNPYDPDRWRQLPLHPASNVNGVGVGMAAPRDFMTLSDPSLVQAQQRLIRKLVMELHESDNVYFEICNEPGYYRGGGRSEPEPERVHAWHRRMVETIREAERPLGKRHLVAVNAHMILPAAGGEAASGVEAAPDVAPDQIGGTPAFGTQRETLLDDGFYRHDPQIDLINVHYMGQRPPRAGLTQIFPTGRWFRIPHVPGSIAAFIALRGAAGKAVGFDEDSTNFGADDLPHYTKNRMEAWEAFVGGCATYDHLDFTFSAMDPTGSGAGHPEGPVHAWLDGSTLRRQLGYLIRYAAQLDLAALRPDLLALQHVTPGIGAAVSTVAAQVTGSVDGPASAAGHQGARMVLVTYAWDARPFGGGFGAGPATGIVRLGWAQPGDRYGAKVLSPSAGEWRDLAPVTADDAGALVVTLPPFHEDLVLHLEVFT